MDWAALLLSLKLGALTVVLLLPLGVFGGRWLAQASFRGKDWLEATIALPLVLPPTVLGYYLLVGFGARSPLGRAWAAGFGHPLAFTFEGLLLASVIINIPFAIQPIQRSFEAIPPDIREAAACCGMTSWQSLRTVEIPLAWPGILTAMVLSFAHTLGEFGVVLMVGGSIPGETKTIAIAIYDRVQAFDDSSAPKMAALLLILSVTAIALTFALSRRVGRRLG